MSRKESVIIVAGGKGLRMGADIPKQFIVLDNLPLLMHTLNAFQAYNSDIQIILVLPIDHQHYWQELCEKYQFKVAHRIADGGETRYHSVKNGLSQCQDSDIIAIHDGVRPFVSVSTIENCFRLAQDKKNAIPVIDSVDSLREIQADGSISVDRTRYKLVQTPQVFERTTILEAYSQAYETSFTDDASVVEKAGHKINLVEGNRENIKITTNFDLIVAESIIKSRKAVQ